MSTRLALHSTDGNETLREGKGQGQSLGQEQAVSWSPLSGTELGGAREF